MLFAVGGNDSQSVRIGIQKGMGNHTLYAYLNINHPMVAWEVAIGRIRSACDLGFEQQNFGISLWQYGLLRKYSQQRSTLQVLNELRLELTRQSHFNRAVSRLRGVYFFESEKDAHAAIERWGIPEKRKFITPVNFSTSNITRVDSEWITSYLNSSETDWMDRYWRGETLGQRPLPEILASGIGLVQSLALREAAYQRIVENFSESTPLLAMACCGLKHCHIESVAQIVPGILRKGDQITIDFYIYIDDFETKKTEIIRSIELCKRSGGMPSIIPPSDPDVFFRIPDLNEGSFSFKGQNIARICSEIHKSIRNQ